MTIAQTLEHQKHLVLQGAAKLFDLQKYLHGGCNLCTVNTQHIHPCKRMAGLTCTENTFSTVFLGKSTLYSGLSVLLIFVAENFCRCTKGRFDAAHQLEPHSLQWEDARSSFKGEGRADNSFTQVWNFTWSQIKNLQLQHHQKTGLSSVQKGAMQIILHHNELKLKSLTFRVCCCMCSEKKVFWSKLSYHNN